MLKNGFYFVHKMKGVDFCFNITSNKFVTCRPKLDQ